MALRRKTPSPAQRPSFIVRSHQHGELTKGDPVRVQGERGCFTFSAYVVNVDTGNEWFDVMGGTPGCETMRAFRLDRVTKIQPKRRRRAS